MNEVIVEKFLQKMSNMMEEIAEVNLLVRRLTPPQETINRMYERIDAIHTGIMQIEKELILDEKRLKELEGQSKSIKDFIGSLESTLGSLRNFMDALQRSTNDKLYQTANTIDRNVAGHAKTIEEKLEKTANFQKEWLIWLTIAQGIVLLVTIFH